MLIIGQIIKIQGETGIFMGDKATDSQGYTRYAVSMHRPSLWQHCPSMRCKVHANHVIFWFTNDEINRNGGF